MLVCCKPSLGKIWAIGWVCPYLIQPCVKPNPHFSSVQLSVILNYKFSRIQRWSIQTWNLPFLTPPHAVPNVYDWMKHLIIISRDNNLYPETTKNNTCMLCYCTFCVRLLATGSAVCVCVRLCVSRASIHPLWSGGERFKILYVVPATISSSLHRSHHWHSMMWMLEDILKHRRLFPKDRCLTESIRAFVATVWKCHLDTVR